MSEAKRVVHFLVVLQLAFSFRMTRSLICLAFPNRLPAAYLCLFNGGVCVSLPTRFVGVDVRSWYDNLRLGMYARAGEVNSSLHRGLYAKISAGAVGTHKQSLMAKFNNSKTAFCGFKIFSF